MTTTYMGLSYPVLNGTTALPLKCSACGEQVALLAPVRVQTIAVMAQAFTELHEHCGKPQSAREDEEESAE